MTAVNPAEADLIIHKTHTGNFKQGQTGAAYTITVTNGGSEPASGTVNVADTLPAGLTATGISGTGWGCTLATLTCTRGDVLSSEASYPAITVTLNVASNAPVNVTNTATVSGGGDVDSGNNIADDLTVIIPPQPPAVAIPAIRGWGMLIFVFLAGLFSLYFVKKKAA